LLADEDMFCMQLAVPDDSYTGRGQRGKVSRSWKMDDADDLRACFLLPDGC